MSARTSVQTGPQRRDSADANDFAVRFASRARAIRLRSVLSKCLDGATAGAVLAVVSAAAAWKLRHGPLRWWALGWVILGTVGGVAVWFRRRWSDEDVALFLDRGLRSDEAIVTALSLTGQKDAVARTVTKAAATALSRPWPRSFGPTILRRGHAILPIACGATIWVATRVLPPPPPAPAPPPGVENVSLSELAGLDEVRALGRLSPKDDAQRERLRALAERADRLKKRLAEGMPRREAQAELSRLRDEVAAERMKLGAGEERSGLESALSKLSGEPRLDAARRALGDRDLTRFDDEMDELANRLEKDDRERAAQALEEAAEAARREGAKDVAKSLEEQRRRLKAQGEGSDALRELAKALGDGLSESGKRGLDQMKREGSSEGRSELGKELAKALEGLTDAERKRLAERLKAAQRDLDKRGDSSGASRLDEMQRELETPEGRRRLAEAMKELAKAPGDSPEAGRERALGDAEQRLGKGESTLQSPSLVPIPSTPGGGAESNGSSGSDGPSASGREPPQNHGGKSTSPVDAEGVRARANAPLNPGAPNPGSVLGRAPGRAGETARVGGEGRLGAVAPAEVSGADRTEIPKEYREQVGRYFPAR